MSAASGPDIIEDGLVLCLDAGNRESYPGSGTTWTSLGTSVSGGTLVNGPTFSSVNNGSIVFDGTNDYVDCTNTTTLTSERITISTWVSFAGPGGRPDGIMFLTKGWGEPASLYYDYFLTFNNNLSTVNTGYRFRLPNSSLEIITLSSTNILFTPNNTWWNITSTYDKQQIRLYINGILNNSRNETRDIVYGGHALTNNIRLGGWSVFGFNRYLNGKLPQVSIYNRALTPAEVLQNYNATKSRFLL